MIDTKTIIAVTGGIGSGKSVVCRVMRDMGFATYLCDEEARRLQESDTAMKRRIALEVCADAIGSDGHLDRPVLAKCVFADPEKLARLNDIVHTALTSHLIHTVGQSGEKVWIVETAILYESGLDRLADQVWEVTAPREVRIERVMKRSGLSRQEILARMANQSATPHPGHTIICHDGTTPILPQLNELAQQLRRL